MDMDVSQVYPVMWQLAGKRCLVVGAGQVAERRIAGLLEAEAAVVIIAPEATEAINAWSTQGAVEWRRKRYERGDLKDTSYTLVLAATDASDVNVCVREDARAAGIPVNAADDPAASDFLLPAVLRRGRLAIAVSTTGASPGAATRIRDELASLYGDEYELFFDFLFEYRMQVRKRVQTANVRRMLLRQVLESDGPALLRSGGFDEWRRRLLDELEQLSGPDERETGAER